MTVAAICATRLFCSPVSHCREYISVTGCDRVVGIVPARPSDHELGAPIVDASSPRLLLSRTLVAAVVAFHSRSRFRGYKWGSAVGSLQLQSWRRVIANPFSIVE